MNLPRSCSKLVLFLFSLVLLTVEGAKIPEVVNLPLPSYVKHSCSRDDPKLNECAVEVGAPAIHFVAQGDPKYHIPVLDPLELNQLVIKEGTDAVGLTLVLKKCQLWNLNAAKFYKAKYDWENRVGEWFLELDKLRVTGVYKASGKILLLPIRGEGDCELNFEKIKFSYKFGWKVVKKSNGLDYGVYHAIDLPIEIGGMKAHFNNLFDGDKFLGDNMNQFINDNWKEIMKDMLPAISKTLAKVASDVIGDMATRVPFDVLFPPKK